MIRASRYVWYLAVAVNVGAMLFDLWTGAYHIAGAVAVLLFLLFLGQAWAEQSRAIVASKLLKARAEQRTAERLLRHVERADGLHINIENDPTGRVQ